MFVLLFFVYIINLKLCLSIFLRKDVSLQPPGDVKKRIHSTSFWKMLSLEICSLKNCSFGWDARLVLGAGKPFRRCVVCRQFKKKLTKFRWFEKIDKFYLKWSVFQFKMVRLDQILGHNKFWFHIYFKNSQLFYLWQELFQDQVQFSKNLISFGK